MNVKEVARLCHKANSVYCEIRGSFVGDLTALELCAGAGGQALGLEKAGFKHLALVEIDKFCCETLLKNRPKWNVIKPPQNDLWKFDPTRYNEVDLVAAGLPCPPFSVAGKQLGTKDDRNLFPRAIEIIGQCRPRAVMIENVRGLLEAIFQDYRGQIEEQLIGLGYRKPVWKLLNASDFGVPQLRPRVIVVAIRKVVGEFSWPTPPKQEPPTVGEVLHELMASKGWKGAKR